MKISKLVPTFFASAAVATQALPAQAQGYAYTVTGPVVQQLNCNLDASSSTSQSFSGSIDNGIGTIGGSIANNIGGNGGGVWSNIGRDIAREVITGGTRATINNRQSGRQSAYNMASENYSACLRQTDQQIFYSGQQRQATDPCFAGYTYDTSTRNFSGGSAQTTYNIREMRYTGGQVYHNQTGRNYICR